MPTFGDLMSQALNKSTDINPPKKKQPSPSDTISAVTNQVKKQAVSAKNKKFKGSIWGKLISNDMVESMVDRAAELMRRNMKEKKR